MLRIGFQGPELEHIAVQMLMVLTCARRPLSPQELSHALSIDESSDAFDEDMVSDMDDLVAACTGLVVLDDTSNIVHLVHKSAAEYFKRTKSRWFPRANEKMAFICLRYLKIAEAKPEETRGEQAPFFRYAKANWSYHSIKSEKEAADVIAMSDASQTDSAIDDITSPKKLAVTRLAIRQMTKEVADVDSSIVEACYAGHQAWVEQLLVVRNYDINKHGISHATFISKYGSLITSAIPTTPPRDNVLLTIAAARGDCGMGQLLLAHGADPNIFNAMGQTPLMIAMMDDFDEFVSLLLEQRSIEPDLMCQYSGLLSTAFLTSIELGREQCFRILLERSNRSARDSRKRGAMWLAASSGRTGIISELLKWSDIEIDYADTYFCGNPLTAAARGSHEDAALLLLPYSKCRSCSHCGVTPMHYAAGQRLHNLLERLLKHDASAVDSELHFHPREGRHYSDDSDQYDIERARTPLTTAIYLQDAQATHILLPYANPNRGLNTWRPLHGAAEWGNTEIFGLLFKQANIEIDPIDEYGRTPFLVATERGHCDIMNALIQKGGIQLDIRNEHGKTPFLLMAERGNYDTMNILIKKGGIQLDIRSGHGKTPFLLMAERKNYDMMNTLIKKGGIQLEIKNKHGKTPLRLASEHGNHAMMKTLIEHRSVQFDGRDALGYVADEYFAKHFPNIHGDYFDILASILDMDVNERDLRGSSFLHRACSLRPKISMKEDMGIQIFEAERLETNSVHLVAELLKRPDTDVNLLDEEGNTPLLLAVKNHQRDVVRLLLEREDTDVSTQGRDGKGALFLASIYQPVFKQLFSKNASSMKAEISPLSGQVPTRYRVDHWPEVLDAEFKEYAESIFSMLLHDERIDLTTSFNEKHPDLTTLFHDKYTDLYHCGDDWDGIIWRVVVAGTKNMVQSVLEVTELVPELKILFSDDRSFISYALEDNEDDEAVELLIAHCSSDVLQKADIRGRTPLSYAAERATSQATQALLKAGVNTNAADQDERTPLSYAAQEGHPNTARLLLASNETLINIPDRDGLTPLMHASRRLNIPVILVFLESSNVDILALDDKGHSFLCYLMMPYYFNKSHDGSEMGPDDVIHRIHHLLQLHICAIKAQFHSPFLCALGRDETRHLGYNTEKQTRDKNVMFMSNLQRFPNLWDLFHPGVNFSQFTTIAGLFKALCKEKYSED